MSGPKDGGPAAANAEPKAHETPKRVLTPQAQRALAEAAARRQAREQEVLAKEFNGREGPEPVRFGDWEVKGIATDF
jgi:hypothetical protein